MTAQRPHHWHVEFTPMEPPAKGTIATAAVRSCMACGEILSGMGGGGSYLCSKCFPALQRRPWRGNMRLLRDASVPDLCSALELLGLRLENPLPKTKPCPHCGGSNLGIARGLEQMEGFPTYIYCSDCGAKGPPVCTYDKALWTCTDLCADKTGWNTRRDG